MGLFRKRCRYCKEKIEKGSEIEGDVKVIGLAGTHRRNFCCEEHVGNYEKEVDEHLGKSKNCGGSCWG